MRLDWPGLLVSYLAAIGTGWVLWPPGAVYWTALAAVIGSGPTLVLVGAIAAVLGAIVRWLPTVHDWAFLAGAVGAYLTGMVWIGHAFVPDDPV